LKPGGGRQFVLCVTGEIIGMDKKQEGIGFVKDTDLAEKKGKRRTC